MYAKYALSRNFVKDEYPHGTTPFVDFVKWIEKVPVQVGENSPGNKRLRTLGYPPRECEKIIPIFHDGVPYIPLEFYVSDLDTIKYCEDNDIIVIAYKVFGRGKLTTDKLSFLTDLAKKYHKKESQIILNWISSKKNMVVIFKLPKFKIVVLRIAFSNLIHNVIE
jgi:hypothetical protein